jgi:hypothetical protein
VAPPLSAAEAAAAEAAAAEAAAAEAAPGATVAPPLSAAEAVLLLVIIFLALKRDSFCVAVLQLRSRHFT